MGSSYIYCWVVAKLPREDFELLADNLELKERPDLLKSQPDLFELYEDVFFEAWDKLAPVNWIRVGSIYPRLAETIPSRLADVVAVGH